MTEKRRPGTHRDHATPARGTAFVKEEPTPPPQEMSAIAISRTPSPDEVHNTLRAMEAQLRTHTAALGEVWEARHLAEKVKSIETELKDNTRSTIRMEAVLGELVVPQVKEQMVKINECLHHLAAGSHVSASIQSLGEKLDDLNASLGGIRTEQATAAERFEAHDLRDREIEKSVHSINQRVGALEQAKAIGEATGKVKRQATRSLWLKSPLVKAASAVLLAIAGAITTYYAVKGG